MQDHNIPLSLFIISVYILTVLVLWNIFSNGHVTVTSCLFLWYDPSTAPQKSLKCGKSTNASSRIWDLLPFSTFKMASYEKGFEADSERSYLEISCHCILIYVHCQVQSLCRPLCGEVISIPNLRTTCLWCILSPTSFQFFENFQKQ